MEWFWWLLIGLVVGGLITFKLIQAWIGSRIPIGTVHVSTWRAS